MRPLRISPSDRPAPRMKAGARRERRRVPRRLPDRAWGRNALIALCLAGTLAIGGAVWWFVQSGRLAEARLQAGVALTELMLQAGLAVREINVIGREETSPAALLAAVGLKRGDPIVFFDAEEARRRIERIAWVENASVQRILPDTILINIVERRPFARWQIDGRLLLVDREGKVLTAADPARFGELRRVVGPGAERHARALFEMLAREPELAARVRDAVRVRDRRWDLEFDNGISVQLPERNADAAWAQLAQMQRERQLLERSVSVIDLRLPDRTVVRLTPEAMEYLNPPKAGRRPGGSS